MKKQIISEEFKRMQELAFGKTLLKENNIKSINGFSKEDIEDVFKYFQYERDERDEDMEDDPDWVNSLDGKSDQDLLNIITKQLQDPDLKKYRENYDTLSDIVWEWWCNEIHNDKI